MMSVWEKFKKSLKPQTKVVKKGPTGPQGFTGPQGLQGPVGNPGIQGTQGSYKTQKCDFCGSNELCYHYNNCSECKDQKPICKLCDTSKHLGTFLNELGPEKTHKNVKLKCTICRRNDKINNILQ